MKKSAIGCLVAMFVVVGVTFGYGAESADQGLFEEKCSTCHSIDRPKSKIKTKQEWESTVMRMKNVNHSPISDQEAKIIIDYLAKHFGK
jgi:nitrate/TMAO reductase-like tetraheme cytochrome c subunit